ncbi:hypothetical protein AK830_g64 [Neonectria ditissima]|uniref:Uncharacterized protein n=1 Tax=Neonectria ditissima TaxID=78410 RepID=A0A0P7BZF3_9HYPO|nr:hypothetical protein AK830_g64 [Neonectria ditissima]
MDPSPSVLKTLLKHKPLLDQLAAVQTMDNTAEMEAQLAWLSHLDGDLHLALLGYEAFKIGNSNQPAKLGCRKQQDKLYKLARAIRCDQTTEDDEKAAEAIRSNRPWMRKMLELLHKVRCEEKSNRAASRSVREVLASGDNEVAAEEAFVLDRKDEATLPPGETMAPEEAFVLDRKDEATLPPGEFEDGPDLRACEPAAGIRGNRVAPFLACSN